MSDLEMPNNLDDAIRILNGMLGEEDLNFIDTNICEDVSAAYHHTLGRHLRNNWGLWTDGNAFIRHMNILGVKHPDDMSGIVIAALWHHRHNVEFDLKGKIAKYQEHWKKYGA